MNIELRKAGHDDIKEIKKLLSSYALDTEKVEKNPPELYWLFVIQKCRDVHVLILGR